MFSKSQSGTYKVISAVIIVSAGFILLKTNGRSGWIGLVTAIFFIVYVLNQKIKEAIIFIAGLVLIGFIAFLFMYKSGSSNGRLLIYKVVVTEMSPKEYLTGIGYGQFKVKYNLLQSQYFNKHDINSKESLLADNTFYAFNDIFQFIIETGIAGIIFLFIIFYLLIHFVFTKKKIILANYILLGACSSLICIITAALFSYPLQIPAILIQFTFCITIISFYGFTEKYIFNKTLYKTISIIIAVLIFTYGLLLLKFNINAKEAFNLSRSGFRHKSIEKYEQLNNSLVKDGNILFQYANELYKINALNKSLPVLQEAKKYYSDVEVYKLIADIYFEQKLLDMAERYYLISVHMIPNRIISRKKLLDFYLGTVQKEKTLFWANSIINMKMKIPSQLINNIQKQTEIILKALNK